MEEPRLRILLIEHDPPFARVLADMLNLAGDTVTEVTVKPDLSSGLAALTDGRVDIVILEFSLPDGAGLANLPLIKDAAPRTAIIVVGGIDDESVAVEAVQNGAQDYLIKSQLTPRWLMRSIRYAVERHRADLSVLQAEVKYRGFFDHLVEGIFQTTPDGRYLMANSALARIYGYASPEELMQSVTDIGRKLYAQPDRRDEFIRLMRELDTITGFESQIYRKDGSVIWISENCRAIRDHQGRLLYYEGTVEDITQRRLAEEALRLKEVQREANLKMAREIQFAMLPQQYPPFPHDAAPGTSALQFQHRYLPAEIVGGDFFHVSALSDTEAAVFICDVAGHGVRSALVAAMIRALLEELRPLAGDPGKFLTKLNSDLYTILKHAGSPLLTTAFYLVANWQNGTLRFANAGHPKPLHLRPALGRVECLADASGKPHPALGLWQESVCGTAEARWAPGDIVLLFTDGLFEVQHAEQEFYTHELLSAAVQRRLRLPEGELFDGLLREIRQFSATGEFADDVCLVSMRLASRDQA